jgi:hypothetical protein
MLLRQKKIKNLLKNPQRNPKEKISKMSYYLRIIKEELDTEIGSEKTSGEKKPRRRIPGVSTPDTSPRSTASIKGSGQLDRAEAKQQYKTTQYKQKLQAKLDRATAKQQQKTNRATNKAQIKTRQKAELADVQRQHDTTAARERAAETGQTSRLGAFAVRRGRNLRTAGAASVAGAKKAAPVVASGAKKAGKAALAGAKKAGTSLLNKYDDYKKRNEGKRRLQTGRQTDEVAGSESTSYEQFGLALIESNNQLAYVMAESLGLL